MAEYEIFLLQLNSRQLPIMSTTNNNILIASFLARSLAYHIQRRMKPLAAGMALEFLISLLYASESWCCFAWWMSEFFDGRYFQ